MKEKKKKLSIRLDTKIPFSFRQNVSFLDESNTDRQCRNPSERTSRHLDKEREKAGRKGRGFYG